MMRHFNGNSIEIEEINILEAHKMESIQEGFNHSDTLDGMLRVYTGGLEGTTNQVQNFISIDGETLFFSNSFYVETFAETGGYDLKKKVLPSMFMKF